MSSKYYRNISAIVLEIGASMGNLMTMCIYLRNFILCYIIPLFSAWHIPIALQQLVCVKCVCMRQAPPDDDQASLLGICRG